MGQWLHEGATTPDIFREGIELSLSSFVACNGGTDLVWVIDDSWYATLTNLVACVCYPNRAIDGK